MNLLFSLRTGGVCLLAILAGSLWAVPITRAQTVGITDVRVEIQSANRVLISYDLPASTRKKAVYHVQAVLSVPGSMESVPLRSVTGDVGKKILPGQSRTIVWDAAADFPNGLDADVRILVQATPIGGGTSKTFLYVLGGALVAGAGTTAALVLGGGGGTPIVVEDSGLPDPPSRPTN